MTFSYGELVLEDQLDLIYNSSVRTQVVVKKTCQKRWMIESNGERKFRKSLLAARHDDNDDDMRTPKSVLKYETYKILLNFKIRTDHPISSIGPDLVLVIKKKVTLEKSSRGFCRSNGAKRENKRQTRPSVD